MKKIVCALYVDFCDVKTGEVYRGVRVSKRCGTWQQNTIVGQHYSFTKSVLRTPSGHWVEWSGLRETFCK